MQENAVSIPQPLIEVCTAVGPSVFFITIAWAEGRNLPIPHSGYK